MLMPFIVANIALACSSTRRPYTLISKSTCNLIDSLCYAVCIHIIGNELYFLIFTGKVSSFPATCVEKNSRKKLH